MVFAMQYKNTNNFTNLCYHTDGLGIDAKVALFEISHGKAACDETGGTTGYEEKNVCKTVMRSRS